MSTERPLAVITGASSGIGTEFARVLAERGCDCVLAARRRERLDGLAEELRQSHGAEVHVVAVDLATPEGPAALFEAVQALERPVAWLVNNAGLGMFGPFADQDLAALHRMCALNMGAVMELTHRFLPTMVAHGSGRILQVSSVGAFQPSPLYAVYSATKSFVRDFSQAVSWELRGTGVTVTSLCPGLTTSEFHQVAVHDTPPHFAWVTMSARSVAEIGVRRAEQGRAHVTPGLMNLIMGWAVKWTPRSISTAAAERAVR